MAKLAGAAVSFLLLACVCGNEDQPNKEPETERAVCLCPLYVDRELEGPFDRWHCEVYDTEGVLCEPLGVFYNEFPDDHPPGDCATCENCEAGFLNAKGQFVFKKKRVASEHAAASNCLHPSEVKDDLDLSDFQPGHRARGVNLLATRIVEFPSAADEHAPTIRAKLFLLEGNPLNAEEPTPAPYRVFGVGYEINKVQPAHFTVPREKFSQYVTLVADCEYELRFGTKFRVFTKHRP